MSQRRSLLERDRARPPSGHPEVGDARASSVGTSIPRRWSTWHVRATASWPGHPTSTCGTRRAPTTFGKNSLNARGGRGRLTGALGYDRSTMANPVFKEEAFDKASQEFRASQPGWAAPEAGTHVQTQPITDGPVTAWQKAMTLNGTITASAVLLVILLDRRGVRLERRQRSDARERRRDLLVPADRLRGHHRRLRRRDRRHAQAQPGQDPRPGLRDRLRLRRRRHLQGLRDVLRRHRRPGRARHGVGVRRDAGAVPHPDHQGHRQVPSHRHHRHDRRDGALPVSRS